MCNYCVQAGLESMVDREARVKYCPGLDLSWGMDVCSPPVASQCRARGGGEIMSSPSMAHVRPPWGGKGKKEGKKKKKKERISCGVHAK